MTALKAFFIWLLAFVIPSSVVASVRRGVVPPNRCTVSFDSIALIRSELYFFKNQYFWRLDRFGRLITPEPVEIDQFWHGLPPDGRVDAAYERPDGTVVFFCGRYYWVFWGRNAQTGYPRPLTDLGLPEELRQVDAAFIGGHNRATYLLTAHLYWRVDEVAKRVEPDSPLPLNLLCRGLPSQLDTAFTDSTGVTYFVQGRHYWKMDPERGQVVSYAPDLVAPRWLSCSLGECCLGDVVDSIQEEVDKSQERFRSQKGDGDGAERLSPSVLGVTLAVAFVLRQAL